MGAQLNADLLDAEHAACVGGDCRLPANVANLVRQGVTVTFNADQPFYERLFFVKNFLDAYK